MSALSRPAGMSAEVWARIGRLPAATRDRVLERACILIFQAGLAPAEADERALAEEGGVPMQKQLGV